MQAAGYYSGTVKPPHLCAADKSRVTSSKNYVAFKHNILNNLI